MSSLIFVRHTLSAQNHIIKQGTWLAIPFLYSRPRLFPARYIAHLRPVAFLYQQMRLFCWRLDVLQLYSPQRGHCVLLNKILFSPTTNSSDWIHLRFILNLPTFAVCTSRPCHYPQLSSISTRYRTQPRVNTSSTMAIICILTTYQRYDLRSIYVHYAY